MTKDFMSALEELNSLYEGLEEGKSTYAFYKIFIQTEDGIIWFSSGELDYYPNQKQLDAYIDKAKEIETKYNTSVQVTLRERRPDWDNGWGEMYNILKVVYQSPNFKDNAPSIC